MPASQSGGASDLATRILMILLILAPIVAAVFMARWNYVRGKGDRAGAMRLAFLIFCLHLALWVFQSHIPSAGAFLYLLFLAVATALLWGGIVWVLYLALEPYVRRYWPQALITWARVMAGRWRDPLVGRDLLFGTAFGIVVCDLYGIRYHLEAQFGAPPAFLSTDYLGSSSLAFGAWFSQVPSSIGFTLLLFLLLFLFRVLLRKWWLAAAAFVLMFTAVKSLSSDYPAVEWPIQIVLYTALAAGALRFGLVALVAALFTADMTLNVPVTLNPSAWYFTDAALAVATVAALAIWGFYIALAGQTPWKSET
jgi:hypothetical protein